MPVAAIIAIVIAFVVIATAATLAGTLALRAHAVRSRFGPEYQRLAGEVGPRRARAELTQRRRRVAQLDIRPLTAQEHARYSRQWNAAQERFIDNPSQATETAAELVTAAARDRGYAADDGQLLTDLSVHHARALEAYRRARETTGQPGVPSTEALRQAMLGYRAMFRELTGQADQAMADATRE